MKFLSKTIGLFVILLSFTAIFTACKSSSDDDPEAQVPRITSISADVTTVVNIAKELTVGVEVSDSGNFNNERIHQGLDYKTPDEVYREGSFPSAIIKKMAA